MAKTRRHRATADILSVCLIHKILCYLSYEEASQMRLLSKTWLQAWSTLPNLKFKVKHISEGAKIVDAIMERYRDDKIPIDKFEFLNYSTTGQIFRKIDKWLGIALQNGVKDIVYKDPYWLPHPYRFPFIKVFAGKSLRELVLSGCALFGVSLLSSGAANCHSLRKLSLSNVSLDEKMLQTLLNSCPLIVSFILERYRELGNMGKIELLNHQNIKSISITTIRNQHVKIQAPTLEHLSYSDFGYSSENFDVVECQNLKSLELKYAKISDEFLDNLISRSQSLKVLKVRECRYISKIDSSNLVSLEYIGEEIPELKMASESSQLKHSKIVLNCLHKLNAAWFRKLRKFLSNLTSSSQVSIDFSGCNEINIKGLQLHHRVDTPQIDILDVNITRQTVECPTFVEALLWSCQPRRLNLLSTAEMTKCFIDCLMDMKSLNHSSSQRSKSWHSQLKEIKAFDGEDYPLYLKSGELATRTLERRKMKGKRLYFLLDW